VEVLRLPERQVATEQLEILHTHLTAHAELFSFQNQLPWDALGEDSPENLPILVSLGREQTIQQS
jgi:hypothetical protein